MKKLTFLILLLATTGLSWGCTEARTADLKPPTPVKTQKVEALAATKGLRYSATIRPATQMELAFKNGGFVEAIHRGSGHVLDKGDVVTKGTVLASLRQADFETRIQQATSQLAEARFALEAARARAADSRAALEREQQDFARAQSLFDSQSLTKTNYDMARAEFESAQAKMESSAADIEAVRSRIVGAESMVTDAKLALQDTALVAPMSGTILERKIETGSLVAGGRAAFVLADTRTVKAVFGVPDLEVHNIKLGTRLDVTSEAAAGLEFHGRITSVSPAADEESRIFETEVTIPNPNDMLKAGMIANVVIGNAPSTEKVAAVPLSAIVRSKDAAEDYAVFVIETLEQQPVARLRPIRLGDAFGNTIVVNDGLKIGERVITVGASLVSDGTPVQIVP
jgi:RND family efflux transporter MFP subunit